MNQPRRIAFLTLTAFLSIGVTLGVTELMCRLRFHPVSMGVNLSDELVFDPQLGWRGKRGLKSSERHPGYPAPIDVQINADGFRDEDWNEKLTRAAARHAKKILLVGDSLLYGTANPVEARASEQLAAIYRLKGIPAEIFNSGIPGYGTAQEYRLLPELLERVHPDEVVVIFCLNDYADTALPYDHRYPVRVYKPFYDENGTLALNRTVPRRPSLVFRDGPLGGLYLWYAIDEIRYRLEDIRFRQAGIPTIEELVQGEPGEGPDWVKLEGLPFRDNVLDRFPRIEATMRALFSKMARETAAQGAGFTVFATDYNQRLLALIGRTGAPVVAFPRPYPYREWTPALGNGHPGFIWGWTVAQEIFRHLEKQDRPRGFADLPQLREIPSQLTFGPRDFHYLFGEWDLQSGERIDRLTGTGYLVVKFPEPAAAFDLHLKIRDGVLGDGFNLSDEKGREICEISVQPGMSNYYCEVDRHDEPLLFLKLTPKDRTGATYHFDSLALQRRGEARSEN